MSLLQRPVIRRWKMNKRQRKKRDNKLWYQFTRMLLQKPTDALVKALAKYRKEHGND